MPEHSETITNRKTWSYRLLLILCVTHVALLGWSATVHSPTKDESAHLASGLAIWRFRDFSLYRVNPPLVKMVAALPVLWVHHIEDWQARTIRSRHRLEGQLGYDFLTANGPQALWLIVFARWACLPFSLIGLLVCWQWARELFSDQAGMIAAVGWCFSPNVLGHGSLLTTDIPAAAMGALAAWRFSVWLQRGGWDRTFVAGVTLGLALLTKSYFVILLPLWPILFCVFRSLNYSVGGWKQTTSQLLVILLIGLDVLNMAYLFQGAGTKLGDFEFYSSPLAGRGLLPEENLPGNRFRDSWIGSIPVPLPAPYVSGIDLQRVDFERDSWNYFWGKSKFGSGWPQYYVIGLFLKVPLGFWLLCGFSVVTLLQDYQARRQVIQLLPLLVPALVVFVMATVQTKMNHHVRYVFLVLPAIYIAGSLAVRRFRRLSMAAVCLAVFSSLAVYPHSLSFFNFAVGGSDYGHQYLDDSNLDWGQDLLFVREWIDNNRLKRPVIIERHPELPPNVLPIEAYEYDPSIIGPGYYILRRQILHSSVGGFKKFRDMAPLDRVAYTHNVYHVQGDSQPPTGSASE